MPMSLNVGISKKQGLPDYGSIAAHCSVTIELDGALIHNDLQAFHRHVAETYTACRQAVTDELARHQTATGHAVGTVSHGSQHASQPPASGNGHGNGASHANHKISQKQLGYIHRLASEIQGLGARGAASLAERMFDKPLMALTSFEGSSLIDTLKAVKSGQIGVDEVLNSGAVT